MSAPCGPVPHTKKGSSPRKKGDRCARNIMRYSVAEAPNTNCSALGICSAALFWAPHLRTLEAWETVSSQGREGSPRRKHRKGLHKPPFCYSASCIYPLLAHMVACKGALGTAKAIALLRQPLTAASHGRHMESRMWSHHPNECQMSVIFLFASTCNWPSLWFGLWMFNISFCTCCHFDFDILHALVVIDPHSVCRPVTLDWFCFS